ncbi:hypothetical protein EG849_00790 [Flavobacterium macacae]|uniref:Uncharacterized protein n=1 Tax=Flavobacterium macacae TaxID=2488993 RepID=A0A3P3WHR5_9FLAO|nr:hypothetical protein EG849_00790 [Flavobacterium macacae]
MCYSLEKLLDTFKGFSALISGLCKKGRISKGDSVFCIGIILFNGFFRT